MASDVDSVGACLAVAAAGVAGADPPVVAGAPETGGGAATVPGSTRVWVWAWMAGIHAASATPSHTLAQDAVRLVAARWRR